MEIFASRSNVHISHSQFVWCSVAYFGYQTRSLNSFVLIPSPDTAKICIKFHTLKEEKTIKNKLTTLKLAQSHKLSYKDDKFRYNINIPVNETMFALKTIIFHTKKYPCWGEVFGWSYFNKKKNQKTRKNFDLVKHQKGVYHRHITLHVTKIHSS